MFGSKRRREKRLAKQYRKMLLEQAKREQELARKERMRKAFWVGFMWGWWKEWH